MPMPTWPSGAPTPTPWHWPAPLPSPPAGGSAPDPPTAVGEVVVGLADATELDTTELDIDQVVDRLVELTRAAG